MEKDKFYTRPVGVIDQVSERLDTYLKKYGFNDYKLSIVIEPSSTYSAPTKDIHSSEINAEILNSVRDKILSGDKSIIIKRLH